MLNKLHKKEIIEFLKHFEENIASCYENGQISGPIHLCGSKNDEQEDALIEIMKDFKEGDWVLSNHRNHYAWLLSGKDPEDLKQQILDGKSMHVTGDKFFVSGSLSGQSPIAVGIAIALKRKGSENKVWNFIGDMSASLGLSQECIRYAKGWALPIAFVVEDNGFSVNTPTKEVWGKANKDVVKNYEYERTKYGHHGTGAWVLF